MKSILFLLLALSASSLFAAKTYHETFATWDKWRNGTFEGTTFAHPCQGLSLGPVVTSFAEFNTPIIWRCALQSKGDLIVATGGDTGQLWSIAPDGKKTLLHEATEVFIRGLVIAKDDTIFFTTSPQAAVYKLKIGSKAELVTNLPAQYIWDMTLDDNNTLYVATGRPASIYAIPVNYKPTDPLNPLLVLKDQSDITTLVLQSDTLYAGTGNSGILYAYSISNKTQRVLVSTESEEITAIVPQSDGSVYYATFHEATPEPENPLEAIVKAIQSASMQAAAVAAKKPTQGDDNNHDKKDDDTHENETFTAPKAKVAFGALYRIDPSGFSEAQWGVHEAGIFSLAKNTQGGFLVGTSAHGKAFVVSSTQDWRLVAQSPSGGAITAMVAANNGISYVCTTNPARILKLSDTNSKAGSYTSAIFDAEQVARWGNLFLVTSPLGSSQGLIVNTRSGNIQDPDESWSPWVSSKLGERIGAPNGRYLQYKITWQGQSQAAVSEVRFFYSYGNRPPLVLDSRVTPLGVQVHVQDVPLAKSLDLQDFIKENGLDEMIDVAATRRLSMRATGEMGFVTCAWDAKDPNGDTLIYTVELQKEGETAWAILAKDLPDPVYSCNTRGLPSGYYRIRITASDALSNSPQETLTGSLVTPPFIVDTLAPVIQITSKSLDKLPTTFTFVAKDTLSIISMASYTLDGGAPINLTPDDGLFDGLEENFTIILKNLPAGPHSLILEVQDESGNTAMTTTSF